MTSRYLVLAMLVACGKSEHGPTRPPLEVAWQASSLSLRGAANADRYELVTLALEDGDEPAWLFEGYRFAPASKIEVGAASASATSDGRLTLRVPAIPMLGAIELAQLITEQAQVDPHLAVAVTPAGEPVQTVTWPAVDVRLKLLGALEKHARAGKPLAFTGGDAAAPPTTLMPQRPALLVGPGKTLADVDRIAVFDAAVDTMVCKGYVGGSYTKPIDLPVQLEQRRVTVHDLRTGKVVTSGAVTATYKCPDKVTTDSVRPGMNIRLPKAEIARWLETH